MAYPVTDNKQAYKHWVVKISFSLQRIDIKARKAETPKKLQAHRSNQVA